MDQSRNPALYQDLAIPDTMTGRFESLSLHMFFALNRLRGNGAVCEAFAQELIDYFVVNLDDALREEGVSDNKVAKRIKGMLTLFYGRIKAYDGAVENMQAAGSEGAQKSNPELVEFFDRTVFEKTDDSTKASQQLEIYFQNAVNHIKNKDTEVLLNCQLRGDEYHALLPKKKV